MTTTQSRMVLAKVSYFVIVSSKLHHESWPNEPWFQWFYVDVDTDTLIHWYWPFSDMTWILICLTPQRPVVHGKSLLIIDNYYCLHFLRSQKFGMAQSRKRLFVVNVNKSVCHYSYVENISFLVCKVLSRSIDVSIDGCAGPVRETVQSLHGSSHDDPGQWSKTSRTLQGDGGGLSGLGFHLPPQFFGRARGNTSLWHFESKFCQWGPRCCFTTCRGASRGFQKRLLIKNPFKKRLEAIYKIVEANCKFQIAPQGLKPFGSLETYSSTCLSGRKFSQMNNREGGFGHSACPSWSD